MADGPQISDHAVALVKIDHGLFSNEQAGLAARPVIFWQRSHLSRIRLFS